MFIMQLKFIVAGSMGRVSNYSISLNLGTFLPFTSTFSINIVNGLTHKAFLPNSLLLYRAL